MKNRIFIFLAASLAALANPPLPETTINRAKAPAGQTGIEFTSGFTFSADAHRKLSANSILATATFADAAARAAAAPDRTGMLGIQLDTGALYRATGTSAGNWTVVSAGGGGGDVASDVIWDAAGDLVVGTGADTAARLAKGTALQVLRVNAGATALEWAAAGTGDMLAANNLSDLANAGTARTNLGLAIGTNVQAFDADLSEIANLADTGILHYRSGVNTWSGVTIGNGITFAGGTLAATGTARTFTDNAARAAATPFVAGQLGVQLDTQGLWQATGTGTGNWSSIFSFDTANATNLNAATAIASGGTLHSDGDTTVGGNLDVTGTINGGVTTLTSATLSIGLFATGDIETDGTFIGDGSNITAINGGNITTATVTLAKLANMATGSFLARNTAGTGVPEVISIATAKTMLSLTGTNSGDQTSIVGITGTTAQFNTSLSDGNFATGGGTATGTNTGDQTITLTGDVTGSGTGSFAATIGSSTVTLAKMANMATASILGRNTAGTGAPEVLSAATTKSLLALNLVENTALSTWAGTTNLTTLGTVTSGIWQAQPLALTYGGHGASDAAGARVNLGLVIGMHVQAFDADLAGISALTGTNTIYYRSSADTWSGVTIGGGLTFTAGTLAATGGTGTQTFADATARAAAVPLVVGQLAVQLDAGSLWHANGTAAGNWSSIIALETINATNLNAGAAISSGGTLHADGNTTVGGTLDVTGIITGPGSGITALDGANIATGTVADARLASVLTGKTYNGLTVTSSTGTLTIAAGKTLTVANTLTLAGTDGSTLNVGAGGTLGSAAFTASTAYQAADADLTTWAGVTPGTGVATALAANVGSAGAVTTFNGAIGAATATTPAADDNDTSVATTAFVQSEIAGARIERITMGVDGGGSVISAGEKGTPFRAPWSGTIIGYTIMADQSGSAVVDVWKEADSYDGAGILDNAPADADSITASALPTLTSQRGKYVTTLTGWSTAITAGDTISFNVDSATVVTRLTVTLIVQLN